MKTIYGEGKKVIKKTQWWGRSSDKLLQNFIRFSNAIIRQLAYTVLHKRDWKQKVMSNCLITWSVRCNALPSSTVPVDFYMQWLDRDKIVGVPLP